MFNNKTQAEFVVEKAILFNASQDTTEEWMFLEDPPAADAAAAAAKSAEFDVNTIPEAIRLSLINAGVEEGKRATSGLASKAVENFLKEAGITGISKEDLKSNATLLKSAPAIKAILSKYKVEKPEDVLSALEQAERKDMSEIELLKADLNKAKLSLSDFDSLVKTISTESENKINAAKSREEKLTGTIKDLISTRVLREMASAEALDPEDVIARIQDQVRVEEDDKGSFVAYVVDSNGVKRFDSSGKPLALSKLVSEFLEPRPHLRKPSLKAGSTGKDKGAALPAQKAGAGNAADAGQVYTKEQIKDPQFFRDNMAGILDQVRKGHIKV